MAINIDEAIESLLNKASTMWAQFSDTCVNAVKTISAKPEKTPADLAKGRSYTDKGEMFKSLEKDVRNLADQRHGVGVEKPQTPSNGN